MFKSVIYKEWIKTRLFIFLILLITIALHSYMYIKVGYSLRIVGGAHIWSVIIDRNQFLFRIIKYFPLLFSIMIALAQFVPEMVSKRLKLALHLPLKGFTIVNWTLFIGAILLVIIYLVNLLSLVIFMNIHFSSEIVVSAIQTLAPWFLAGIIAYFLTAWIILEPRWIRRVINLLISSSIVPMFYIDSIPGAYVKTLPLLVCLVFVSMCIVVDSVKRFKQGK